MRAKRNIAIALPSTGLEEWEATRECFETGWLTQGPKVAAFEKAFAERHRVKHAISVTSCTTGLHLALVALGIGAGDEVLVPAFTWVATANAVLYCGATPVIVDVDPETYNIDPLQVCAKLSSKTKAVMVVHLFGLAADMDRLREVLPAHIPIIEDAACAAGAEYRGQCVGSLGHIGVFSFHPRKAITTGEGGMITTNDDALAARMSQMRNHGATISEEQRHRGPRPYLLPEFDLLGYNYRMTDLQGAVGLVQLGKLDKFVVERRAAAQRYFEQLKSIPWLKLPVVPEYAHHVWQSFVCMVDEQKAGATRNEIMEYLQQNGISTRPGTHCVPTLTYYRKQFGYGSTDYPQAVQCELQSLALPLHNRMSNEDYDYVCEVLENFSAVCP